MPIAEGTNLCRGPGKGERCICLKAEEDLGESGTKKSWRQRWITHSRCWLGSAGAMARCGKRRNSSLLAVLLTGFPSGCWPRQALPFSAGLCCPRRGEATPAATRWVSLGSAVTCAPVPERWYGSAVCSRGAAAGGALIKEGFPACPAPTLAGLGKGKIAPEKGAGGWRRQYLQASKRDKCICTYKYSICYFFHLFVYVFNSKSSVKKERGHGKL